MRYWIKCHLLLNGECGEWVNSIYDNGGIGWSDINAAHKLMARLIPNSNLAYALTDDTGIENLPSKKIPL